MSFAAFDALALIREARPLIAAISERNEASAKWCEMFSDGSGPDEPPDPRCPIHGDGHFEGNRCSCPGGVR